MALIVCVMWHGEGQSVRYRAVQDKLKIVPSMVHVTQLYNYVLVYQGGLEIPVISLTVLVVVKAMVSVMELTEIYQNVTVKMVGTVKIAVKLVSMVT